MTLEAQSIKMYIKVKMLKARLLIRNGDIAEACRILWKNLAHLQIEFSLRTNRVISKDPKAGKFDNPKLIKWAKYTLSNLGLQLGAYLNIDEIELASESATLIQFVLEAFFDDKDEYYTSWTAFLTDFGDQYSYQIRSKKEMSHNMKTLLDNLFSDDIAKEEAELEAQT